MKKIFSVLCAVTLIAVLFTACNGTNSAKSDFVIPDNIMTTEEYHKEIDALLQYKNCSTATDEFYKKLDEIDKGLEEQIIYNMEDVTECTGTKYYVSNSGNDENDGKSPKNAWATIEKVSIYEGFKKGDLVLFERGGLFRGTLNPHSGVTY